MREKDRRRVGFWEGGWSGDTSLQSHLQSGMRGASEKERSGVGEPEAGGVASPPQLPSTGPSPPPPLLPLPWPSLGGGRRSGWVVTQTFPGGGRPGPPWAAAPLPEATVTYLGISQARGW